jgi:xanthine/CO dehydrogenase XdhC/CoxF family maturation factor
MSLIRLLPLFDRARAAHEPLALATVVRTAGSTYAKPGAQMVIAADGEYAGLLSGGCLEGDLLDHARQVIATGDARIVSYDLRSNDDQLFGLGAGCEGAMDILLSRVGADQGWQPLPFLIGAWQRGDECRVAFVVASDEPGVSIGATFPADGELPAFAGADGLARALHDAANAARSGAVVRVDSIGVELFVADFAPAPELLLLGGGPDARPVAELAAFLGWRVTVVDHRATYLDPRRFPPQTHLVETRAEEVASAVSLDDFSAAVVMSHALAADLHYLRALAASRVPYVGLLGPAARREKLLADLGTDAHGLRARLRAPVGLDIGGRAPESIALSIIGEVHAVLAGRGGRPFSEVMGSEVKASGVSVP